MATAAELALTELELDALIELVNVGVSCAATSLRDMIGKPVMLSVPGIDLLTTEEAANTIGKREHGRLIGVHEAFDGDLSGRALLIFPEAHSLELVRATTGEHLSAEEAQDVEEEALTEIGNILLNNCISTIANQLQRHLKISLPQFARGGGEEILDMARGRSAQDSVLFLYIDFNVMGIEIRGYITVLMEPPAMTMLRMLLQEYIGRTTGD